MNKESFFSFSLTLFNLLKERSDESEVTRRMSEATRLEEERSHFTVQEGSRKKPR